mgnify:CR=1 FL=1
MDFVDNLQTEDKEIFEIIGKAIEYLNDNGELWIVIQKKQGAESALKHLKGIYKEVEIVTKDGGYWIITARK